MLNIQFISKLIELKNRLKTVYEINSCSRPPNEKELDNYIQIIGDEIGKLSNTKDKRFNYIYLNDLNCHTFTHMVDIGKIEHMANINLYMPLLRWLYRLQKENAASNADSVAGNYYELFASGMERELRHRFAYTCFNNSQSRTAIRFSIILNVKRLLKGKVHTDTVNIELYCVYKWDTLTKRILKIIQTDNTPTNIAFTYSDIRTNL